MISGSPPRTKRANGLLTPANETFSAFSKIPANAASGFAWACVIHRGTFFRRLRISASEPRLRVVRQEIIGAGALDSGQDLEDYALSSTSLFGRAAFTIAYPR